MDRRQDDTRWGTRGVGGTKGKERGGLDTSGVTEGGQGLEGRRW